MFKILTLFFVIFVVVHCELNCNSCSCDQDTVSCSHQPYNEDVLQSEYIKIDRNVQKFTLESVPFKELPGYVFMNASLGTLKTLKISHTGLKIIDKNAFKGLKEVVVLNINSNKIAALPVGVFEDNQDIQELYCEGNEIEVLEDGLLDNLYGLKIVTFSNNQIKRIGDNFFNDNYNLKVIRLQSNLLSYMDGRLLHKLQKITTFSINYNPWLCDCKLAEFHKFSLNYLEFYQIPKCSSDVAPLNKQHKMWEKLVSSDFKCSAKVDFQLEFNQNYSSRQVDVLCKVSANPIPLSIELNHNQLPRGNPSGEHTYTYKFTMNVDTERNNTYSCYASNSEGSENKTITGQEVYEKFLKRKKHIPSKSVTFVCNKFTNRATYIKWFFKNTSLNDDVIYKSRNKYRIMLERSSDVGIISKLTINYIKESDYGTYKCMDLDETEEQKFELIFFDNQGESSYPIGPVTLGFMILTTILLIGVIILAIWCHWKEKQDEIKDNIRMMTMYNRERHIDPSIYRDPKTFFDESAL